METYVTQQGLTLIYGVIAGLLLGSIYVISAVIRDAFGAGTVVTAVFDTLFGFFSAVFVFTFLFIFNRGIIRAYLIAAIIMGMYVPVALSGALLKSRRSLNRDRHTVAGNLINETGRTTDINTPVSDKKLLERKKGRRRQPTVYVGSRTGNTEN